MNNQPKQEECHCHAKCIRCFYDACSIDEECEHCKTSQDTWEEEYEAKFSQIYKHEGGKPLAAYGELKQFIASKIALAGQKERAFIGKQKREWYQKGFEEAVQTELQRIIKNNTHED